MDEFFHKLQGKVRAYGFTCQNEFDMQNQFAEFLHAEDYSYRREVQLSARDRCDFTINVPGGIVVVEAKIKPPTIAHLRQLERYAIPTAKALILLSVLSIKVPPALAGRPCYNLALWRNVI